MAIILGVESTAHTFGVGIVKNGKVLANVKDIYTTEKGGIIPMDAAKHHEQKKYSVYEEALKTARIKEGDISAIAFSQGMGKKDPRDLAVKYISEGYRQFKQEHNLK